MRSFFSSLVRSIVLCGAVALAASAKATEPGVLLWGVNPDATVDFRGEISTVSSFISWEGYDLNGARVAAYTPDGAVTYLNLYYESELTDISVDVLDFESSPDWASGPTWASFENIEGADATACSFAIELGHYWINEEDDSLSWCTLALSERHTYQELNEKFISSDVTQFPAYGVWTPGAYVVPEPSGALLLVIGSALLALRRKEVKA